MKKLSLWKWENEGLRLTKVKSTEDDRVSKTDPQHGQDTDSMQACDTAIESVRGKQ